MTDTSVYNARDSRYKSPYGAVAAGTPVHFTLRPRRAEGFSRGVLTARLEQAGNRVLECPMPWTDTDFDRDAFSCTLDTGDYVGLVWYSFRLETLRGRVRELGPYQLTVYDGSDSVPGWFGNGLCYQIFPDRFYRTRIPDPTGTVGGRLVHRDWFEAPLDGRNGTTGTFLAGTWRESPKSWTIWPVWGWRPSTCAPSSPPPRTTGTAPPTTKPLTPCWGTQRISSASAPRPTPGVCG